MNTSTTTLESIQLAAIRVNNDVTVLPKPGRHNDIIKFLVQKSFDLLVMEFGFVTSTGRYVDRIEAKSIALNAGQLKNTNTKFFNLTSEDLW
jgi:hypothetical protein